MSSISKSIFSGALWTTVQTVGLKLSSILGQLILAYILSPEDFGKIGLTYTITSIGILFQSFGLTDVLVNRGKSFLVLMPLAKSVSLIGSVICWIVTIILGFVGSIFLYNDIEIFYLVVIFSFSIPFDTLSVVPDSRLMQQLRFKDRSLIQVYAAFLTQILTVVFALFSFGVYSFVLPITLVAILRYLYITKISETGFRISFTLRRWKHLVVNSAWSFLYALSQRLIQQLDFIILGVFVLQSEVGVYFLAFSLSIQVIGFLVGAISPIVFPVLMQVPKEDTTTVKNTLNKLTYILALIGMPFALWQAVSAEPLIKLFLQDKWIPCILITQILSLGIGFQVVSSLWVVTLRINGEFKKQAELSFYSLLLFVILVVPLTYLYKSVGTAIAVSAYYMISGPVLSYLSFKKYDISFIKVLHPYIKYFIVSIVIFGSIFYISSLTDCIYIKFLMNVILSPIIYLIIIYFVDRQMFLGVLNLVKKRNLS
ncbi:oligosaccharide flippase family protein [Dysgonomonas sp. 520]|uniref:oligosaccharide flippase family protein n=1 Tax=Dysgonomonas sp. 520 TaxID=2302931 RepID=UPI0013CFD077|nr:oligosaccharide flippase family protein [Dysgonomonas sp. 520]NDW09006.1 hypothetical protein [Dysgonomonas sp. 520]